MRTYQAPPVDLPFLSGSRVVDANIVTDAEYDMVMQLIDAITESQREQMMIKLVLILGRRCGMRRGEVATLHIKDLKLFGPSGNRLRWPELIIRNNRFRNTKTESGKRRLPLYVLLSPSELDLLFEFYRWQYDLSQRPVSHSQATEDPSDNIVFFSDPGHEFQPLPERRLFGVITRLLKTVTGDETIRYHHLRHTAANYVMTLLYGDGDSTVMLPNLAAIENKSHDVPVTTLSPCQALVGTAGTQPNELYALSLLMGHASPDETRRSYLHCFDWLLLQACRCHAPAISSDIQANLLAKTSKNLYQWRYRQGLQNKHDATTLWDHCWPTLKSMFKSPGLFHARAGRPFFKPTKKQVKQLQRPLDNSPISLEKLNAILCEYDHGMSADTMVARYDVSVAQLDCYLAQARYQAELKTAQNRPRFVAEQSKKNQSSAEVTNLLLPPPRSLLERGDATVLYNTIIELNQLSPEWTGRMLNFFLSHFSENRFIRCTSVEMARDYLAFLREILDEPERIAIAHLPSNAGISHDLQLTYWADALAVPIYGIRQYLSQKQSRHNAYGYVAIHVKSPYDHGRIQRENERRKEGRFIKIPYLSYVYSSYGFKYALYMAAVCIFAERSSSHQATAVA